MAIVMKLINKMLIRNVASVYHATKSKLKTFFFGENNHKSIEMFRALNTFNTTKLLLPNTQTGRMMIHIFLGII